MEFKYWFWSDGVIYILYLIIFISGVFLAKSILDAPIKEKMNHLHYKNRLRKIRMALENEKTTEYRHPLMKHIFLLIKTTSKESTDNDVLAFWAFTSTLSIFTSGFLLYNFHDIILAITMGLIVGSIPYMILQVRLRKLRYLMGEEFLTIVQTLTQQYNAHGHDMYYALVETQKTVQNKTLRSVFLRLISDLQVSRNEKELKLSISVFVYTAGSSWSKRLGNIMLKSYLHNENVLSTLLVLTRQIEETESMLEQEKSQTLDSVYNGYLTVPIFVAALGLGYAVSGAQDWFQLQFQNFWTLLLLTISFIGVIFSVFLSMILKRPKNDI
ncbi:hypothetical protein [Metabacillus halosaccharovorans]|uniref:hypothetical protein n=1 Tax=Metabacillus halosaccharovorans TaxID=930124 RepID=UPI000C7FCD1C|nr:hypothetical protein [Metabacillus halosaccharovorans]MBU7595891.1 hypothetical protein [Metabacillus halosaccharovorans]PMC36258.1 hypothetical protein CJ195_15715 [Bacillus sp. UMB0899]